jgi:hypothetical protein
MQTPRLSGPIGTGNDQGSLLLRNNTRSRPRTRGRRRRGRVRNSRRKPRVTALKISVLLLRWSFWHGQVSVCQLTVRNSASERSHVHTRDAKRSAWHHVAPLSPQHSGLPLLLVAPIDEMLCVRGLSVRQLKRRARWPLHGVPACRLQHRQELQRKPFPPSRLSTERGAPIARVEPTRQMDRHLRRHWAGFVPRLERRAMHCLVVAT